MSSSGYMIPQEVLDNEEYIQELGILADNEEEVE